MAEYRIDDLAREAGTTTRNVRGYQERGLLPKPQRRGRVAIYTDNHLAILRAINKLLSRGFTAKHITEFFSGLQRGDDLAQVLDIPEIIAMPWANTRTASLSTSELARLLGTDDPELFDRLAALGTLRPIAPGQFELLDADLLKTYGRLIRRGVRWQLLIEAYDDFQTRLDDAARVLTGAARSHFAAEHGDGWAPKTAEDKAAAAELLTLMRKAGGQAAHHGVDRAMDRATESEVASYLEARHDVEDQGASAS
ncbi:MerR family transcriptional regulator [Jongsikchunia kroppenstedtii]|uniref:MerR family transcriptional regulator n=1 Tax=Jongsikchunia kroppenstedtii TaxID=1121721 RepID=UPI00037275AA|nr:MerR family transcriptional regulator [Jongsikchunia kroppenstedtii]